jgi:hypothetical protein
MFDICLQSGEYKQPLACVMHNPYIDIGVSQQAANARLISAAPDMLAALEAYVARDVYESGPDWYEAMRAAIAKATGASA